MAAAYVLTTTTNDQFMFNLRAGNNEIILTSETYVSESGAENGIESVRTNSPIDDRYDRRTSSGGDPYFVLKAANGEIIGRSEMYSTTAVMETGIESVKTNRAGAPVEDRTA